MYNDFYGFSSNPFHQTPDSSFFFPSEKHQAALDALLYAVTQNKGFVVITGEIGSGKTTVIRTALKKLDRRFKTALITNTQLSPKGVITMFLQDLGCAYRDGTKDKLLIQLNEFLIQEAQEDRSVLLVIDEAQNLSPTCLEEVRMLSNLETEKEKLLQIILVGQPELRHKLQLKQLEQLKQRVAVHCHIEPLDRQETTSYILHRLNRAKSNGHDFKSLIPRDGFRLIFDFTQGVPRKINLLCDYILLTGCLAETKVITSQMVKESISELQFSERIEHE